ncbi:hypothetical protein [Mycobacterium sp. 852002-40037_SCH5390672]|uniref:hypothetical protein n=1 Tax=Mycobacterium sp. 852002-40037_SCH5390672 TaxID=1834089 RepID=UPI000A8769B9|nr:hypothetical protein [Mycobacterium sp. 852002-40037_SCH5390672]
MFRGVGDTRRWQRAIATVAALGVFVALITGSALRSGFAATALPEPAAWSAGNIGASAGPTPGRPSASSPPALAISRSAAPANKTNNKPFHSTWATKERPQLWNRLSPQSMLTPASLSFIPIGFAPGGVQSRAPAAIPSDRDILTQICVARR